MIEDDTRNIAYQDYTASMLKNLTGSFISFAGGKAELPSFLDIVYPQMKDKPLTAQEIKERTIRLFS